MSPQSLMTGAKSLSAANVSISALSRAFPPFRVQYFRLKAAKSSFRVVGQFSETYSIWFAKMLAEGSLTTVGLRPPSVSRICFGIEPSSKVAAACEGSCRSRQLRRSR